MSPHPRLGLDPLLLGVVLCATLGTLVPVTGVGIDVLTWATRVAIALLFLGYGATLSTSEALRGLLRWRLHLIILVVTYAVFPLLGLAARWLPDSVLDPALYPGLLFLCLVPSAVQSSITFTSMARGNVGGAVVSASLSNLLGVVLTPVLVVTLMTTAGAATLGLGSVATLVAQLLVPFVVGQLLQHRIGGWIRARPRVQRDGDRGAILLIVYAAFGAGARDGVWSLVSAGRVAWVALWCCVLLALVLAASAGLGWLLRLDHADTVALLFCGSKKSLASGLPMAAVLFGAEEAALLVLPLMIFHQVQLMSSAVLARRLAARVTRAGGSGEPRPPTSPARRSGARRSRRVSASAR